MSDEDLTKIVETKSGASVTVEHKRGSGTRDQDKVKVKIHDSVDFVEHNVDEAVDQATDAMETLRSSNKELGDGE